MQLRLGLTFHSVFYAPFYVALHLDLFTKYGLEVAAEVLGQGHLLLERQARGELDVGLGGVMRSLVAYDQGGADAPVHFARVNDRDGFFLLGRSPDFDWNDLLGRRLIVFSEAPTPWYILRALLIERGLDPNSIHVTAGLPASEAAAAFRRGEADFLEAPAHVAEDLVLAGDAHVVKEMAAEAGPLPYSSYCATTAVLSQRADHISAFIRAHVAALDWMRSVDGREIWELITPSFRGGGDPVPLRRAVERYHRLGLWSSDATIPRAAYRRLAEYLQRGGLISTIATYERCCDDSLVRGVLANRPDG